VKILIFGYSQICYLILEYLLKQKENVIGLFTHKNNPKENIWFKTPDIIAKKYSIPVYYPENVNTKYWINFITKKLQPDIIFSIYYRKKICNEIITFPKYKSINFHGSYLPKYRGAAPLNWALINGEKTTGVTFHYMTEKFDAGDIISQKKIKISKKDDINSLYKKFFSVGLDLFKTTFKKIKENKIRPYKQNEKLASYYSKRKPEDGLINWNLSAEKIYNLIRAVTYPFPGAFSFLNGSKFIIWQAEPVKKIKNLFLLPGEGKLYKKNLYIGTGNGLLKIIKYTYNEPILKFANGGIKK